MSKNFDTMGTNFNKQGGNMEQTKNNNPKGNCWNCGEVTGFGHNQKEPTRYDTIICSTDCRKVLDREGWKPRSKNGN